MTATTAERLTWGYLGANGVAVHRADPEALPKAVAVCGLILRCRAPEDWRTCTQEWDYRPCWRCWREPTLEGI